MEEMEGVAIEIPRSQPIRHIKKRALKNKALTISFNDKDLRDFVSGFHKRKKKRRKEAQKQSQEKERQRRIYARQQRKLEREFALYGGVVPQENPSGPGEDCDNVDEDMKSEPNTSVSGTKVYDNGDTTIMVTTSEISREDEDMKLIKTVPKFSGEGRKQQHSLQVKKKSLKKMVKQKSRRKAKKSSSQKNGNRKKSKNKR